MYGPTISDLGFRWLPVGLARACIASRPPTHEEYREAIDEYLAGAVACTVDLLGGGDGFAILRSIVAAVFDMVTSEYEMPVVAGPRDAISASTRRTVFERDRYRCRACGAWVELQVDHVVPHALGGPSVPENLQALCGSCNRQKRATL